MGNSSASYPTDRLPFLEWKKTGVVDSRRASEQKGLRASACKKNGTPSTVLNTPVPALGDRHVQGRVEMSIELKDASR